MAETLHASRALLPQGWARDVRVSIGPDGRIASVEAGVSPAPGDRQLGAETLLPAPANLHSHTFQRAMAGLAEHRSGPAGDDFWSWRTLMYRFLDRMSPDDVEAVAAMAFVEMLEGGFAACVEFHYLHHGPAGAPYEDRAELSGRIAAAAGAAGIGLTLLPVYYQRGGVDGRPLVGGQLRFGTDRDGYPSLLEGAEAHLRHLPPDARLGLAPHSLRAAAPEDIAWVATLLPGAPVHIHAAEQTAEVEDVAAAYGARPVELLLGRCGAEGRWCLIHATHMTAAETRALAASGVVAGLCPVTESNLGDGIFPARDFLAAGGRFGIGTDSNILIDAATELRTLEYSQRLQGRARVVLADAERSAGRLLWQEALAGGAAAAGRPSGAIAPELFADLLTLPEDALELASREGDQVLDSFVFAMARPRIGRLWSAGRLVVEEGRARHREPAERAYRRALAALLAA
ncbi:MAG TPA: formimidoylglutamate deiminase [Paracoccaceae bacterium]|nr:formimidoylglutamate deiminase [Paracoccaceae bacterium]